MNAVLYRIVDFVLAVLPVDAAGRRVFDETLADWRREAEKAEGALAGALVAVRAIWSVFRSIAGVSVRELKSIPQNGVLLRVFLWTAGCLTTATLTSLMWFGPPPVEVESRAYLMVARVAYFLPIALLLATGIGRARRAASGLGLGLAAVVVALPLLGWALPVANRAFLLANRAQYTDPKTPQEAAWRQPYKPGEGLTMTMMSDLYISGASVSRTNAFGNDLTLVQLGERVAGGPQVNGWAAIRWLSFFGAYLTICAIAPLLSSTLRGRAVIVRYGVILVTAMLLLKPPVLSRSGDDFSVTLWLGTFWIPVAWMSLCVAFASRRNVLVSEPSEITNNQ